MKRNLEKRLEALEEKAKPPMISTLVDLLMWLDEHEDDEEELEVEISPELQELLDLPLKHIEKEPPKTAAEGIGANT